MNIGSFPRLEARQALLAALRIASEERRGRHAGTQQPLLRQGAVEAVLSGEAFDVELFQGLLQRLELRQQLRAGLLIVLADIIDVISLRYYEYNVYTNK